MDEQSQSDAQDAVTRPFYVDEQLTLYHGDNIDVLATMADCSVDSVVTDPPYGIGFMGHEWDQPGRYGASTKNGRPSVYRRRPDGGLERISNGAMEAGRYDLSRSANARFGAWCEQWARECFRVLKPGGYLVAFGGARTWHRLATGIEDAGFEMRDSIAWLFGSGFPKSLDVAQAIDRAAGATRDVGSAGRDRVAHLRGGRYAGGPAGFSTERGTNLTGIAGPPVTDDAARWDGWGTALKPGFEPIVLGRKPLAGTVAANVLAYGTGGLHIDACRVDGDRVEQPYTVTRWKSGATLNRDGGTWKRGDVDAPTISSTLPPGRWPPNVVLDQSQAADLDAQTGTGPGGSDSAAGGVSRFFPTFRYEAKAPASERPRLPDGTTHSTVKPLGLTRWLVRLVTPPAGTVLDLFLGSGTTAEACLIEGFTFIGIDRKEEYLRLTVDARLRKPIQPDIFGAST
jgi:DNA modification methylase